MTYLNEPSIGGPSRILVTFLGASSNAIRRGTVAIMFVPAATLRLKEYASGPPATLGEEIMQGFARTAVPDAEVAEVARAIVRVVEMPFGKRPFRVHVDPANDGAEAVSGVADRVRAELLRNMGLSDLLHPTTHQTKEHLAAGVRS
jgi:hypothetical protein